MIEHRQCATGPYVYFAGGRTRYAVLWASEVLSLSIHTCTKGGVLNTLFVLDPCDWYSVIFFTMGIIVRSPVVTSCLSFVCLYICCSLYHVAARTNVWLKQCIECPALLRFKPLVTHLSDRSKAVATSIRFLILVCSMYLCVYFCNR